MSLLLYLPKNTVSNDFQHNLACFHCWHHPPSILVTQENKIRRITSPPCCICWIFFEINYLTLVPVSCLFRINNLLLYKVFEMDYNKITFMPLYMVCRYSEKNRKMDIVKSDNCIERQSWVIRSVYYNLCFLAASAKRERVRVREGGTERRWEGGRRWITQSLLHDTRQPCNSSESTMQALLCKLGGSADCLIHVST